MNSVNTIIRHLLLSTIVLLTATSVLHAATTDALRQAHGPRCAKPVFYAQTVNHKKEVEICIVTPSVSYSFGKTGAKNKEINITIPAGSTSYTYTNNQVISIQNFTVRNGDTSYQVSAGSDDSGEPFASLNVYKGIPETGKLLAEIRLDPVTVENNIGHALADESIPEADSL